MRRILLTICFDGTEYHGWQVQKNAVGVQQVLQDAVEDLFGSRLDIHGCSRTDSGVHANMYCCHFDTESDIPCVNIVNALNVRLPRDIAATDAREVGFDFHARYSCRAKEYVYKIYNDPIRNPFLEKYTYRYSRRLDDASMRSSARCFIGRHDFSAFCSSGASTEDNVRSITDFTVTRSGDIIELSVRGDGFLYNMVRIMVGTLLFIEQGRIAKEELPDIILSGDRSRAGKTMPPHGLYLNRVFY